MKTMIKIAGIKSPFSSGISGSLVVVSNFKSCLVNHLKGCKMYVTASDLFLNRGKFHI